MSNGPDAFVPVTALGGETTDLALLPQHVRLLTREVRDGFEMIGTRLMPAIDRIEAKLDDHAQQLREHAAIHREHATLHGAHARDIHDLKAHITRLEQASAGPAIPPRKRSPRAKR